MSITKAIFCVAGYGTRFLPATKAQPKEMLPLVDKPIIQYLVEEAVESGIKDIVFVTGRGKSTIENHFDRSFELEHTLVGKGKHEVVEEVDKISKLANFAYVRQPIQKGDGHALLCAMPFIDISEPILVVFPDYLMPAENKTLARMIKAYEYFKQPILGTDYVDESQISQYGGISFHRTDQDNIVKIDSFIEKPKKGNIPDGLILEGKAMINNGYAIINEDVWQVLSSSQSTTEDGEIRVADAFVNLLNKNKPLYAVEAIKHGYDCGNKIGFLKATVDLALAREDLGVEFLSFLQSKLS
jgi:UTP--glucose-1-phosphate uridylyltransferase